MAGHGVRGETKASENRLSANARQKQALELRMAGYGYEAIAERLGYGGPSGAFKAIQSAMKATLKEPADAVRELEVKRLDTMLAGIWIAVRNGNLQAIDRALKIMTRRAELLGLDAPARVNVDLMVRNAAQELGLTDDETARLLEDAQAFIDAQKAGVA